MNRFYNSPECSIAAVAFSLLVLCGGTCSSKTIVLDQSSMAEGSGQSSALIPWPAMVTLEGGERFELTPETVIHVEAGQQEAWRLGEMLSALLAPGLGTSPVVTEAPTPERGYILLTTQGADPGLGHEGYGLRVSPEAITLRAPAMAGLYYGVQTLRQLLPASIEYRAALPHPLWVPVGHVTDQPRFAWRGAMLDVARHFRTVDEVKRYLDLMALYKLNRLHLHLSDDQGWRIEIKSWPALTEIGASTEVGGGPGGYYSQEDYTEIVRYAAERYITIVPEIDMPGHINAAMASIPELNCDDQPPPLYTGIKVGFSALCLEKEITYTFIDDVVREIAALTPGPYFHLGGDEVKTLSAADYAAFIRRAAGIVQQYEKQPIGWDEIALVDQTSEEGQKAIIQWWRPVEKVEAALETAAVQGHQIIVSPAHRNYLDMKYDSTTVLGLRWAGLTSVETAYDADPATLLPTIPESLILGVEAPLWAETTDTMADVEYLAFPRLAGIAEIGWTPASALDWSAYRQRLAQQAKRWSALGINYYRAPEIPWQD